MNSRRSVSSNKGKQSLTEHRVYVLDTNVLMHDPAALFRFQEHDIYLPMMVLEELDAAKKGMSEVARNARQASRFINELMEHFDGDITQGIPLQLPHGLELAEQPTRGRLRFQTSGSTSGDILPDQQILNASQAVSQNALGETPIIVSKDINLRIKATIQGIACEDYYNDHILDDLSLLYTGAEPLEQTFWDETKGLRSWTEGCETYYELKPRPDHGWYPNQFLYQPDAAGTEVLVDRVDSDLVRLRVARDYRSQSNGVWGICARNREQNFALNLLLDDRIDFVTLMGTAGTGKTLLSLAAGLHQTFERKRYSEIVMTRATVPLGEDIGFLPGTEEEKMTPWMGALTDNLEFLGGRNDEADWSQAAAFDLLNSRIKIRSLSFMRGRTFFNRYVIIDEAQNLTPKQIKTLLTRAGPGTKMVCLGNVEQIDTPYLTETSSGLTYAIDHFKSWPHSGHVTLRRGERSRLADYASTML